MDDAREWAATAMSKRPWRERFFQQFITELRAFDGAPIRVLELGSGPGFLAQSILEAIPTVEYTMLDFSQAMHDLARARLGPLMRHVRPIVADFKLNSWGEGRGEFDAVVTNQAVHELRHKKHALEHFPEKWTSGFPQKMRPDKDSRARSSAFSIQRKRNAL
jgi:ubiquinone/menaquinone biosynthesis C-methylase UbiE